MNASQKIVAILNGLPEADVSEVMRIAYQTWDVGSHGASAFSCRFPSAPVTLFGPAVTEALRKSLAPRHLPCSPDNGNSPAAKWAEKSRKKREAEKSRADEAMDLCSVHLANEESYYRYAFENKHYHGVSLLNRLCRFWNQPEVEKLIFKENSNVPKS